MTTRVLVVDDNPLKLKLATAVLEQDGYLVYTATSGPEALKIVDNVQPQAIVLDVMMPEMDGYQVCRALRRKPNCTHLPILMLTAQDSLEEKMKGFESGADDYMTTPYPAIELQTRLKSLLQKNVARRYHTANTNGKVIAVFSLRGGAGISTIAANVAVGLAQLWNTQSVLVDLSLLAGQCALLLNLPLRQTWADLAQHKTEALTIEQINDALLSHTSGALVLASPLRLEQSETITAKLVGHVINLLQQHYHYVVLDLPHDFRDTTLAGLDASHQILTVVTPDLASLNGTGSTLNLFAALKYPTAVTRLIFNTTCEKSGLPRQDIEAALKQSLDAVIPFMPTEFVDAINHGEPSVLKAPTRPVGVLFEDMAWWVSKDEHKQQRPTAPSDAWQRVTQRAQQRLAARRNA
jgi:pilus assembly protein CpaE